MLTLTLHCSFIFPNLSRNLFSRKVLLVEVKLRSSSFVSDAFVLQVNPIKFEECDCKIAYIQNAQSDWLDLNGTSAARISKLGFNIEDPGAI